MPLRSLLLCLCLAALPAARAGELGYWQTGMLGLRETLVPPRGLHARLESSSYHGEVFRDRTGGRLSNVVVDLPVVGETKLSLKVVLDVHQIRPALVLVPLDLELGSGWGLRYGLQVAPSLTDGSLNPSLTFVGRFVRRILDESDFGIGDLFLQPVWVGLRLWRLELAGSYGLYLATGEYEASGRANRGNGFLSHQLQLTAALSLDPNRMGALVTRLTWELPERQQETRLVPGSRFTLEVGYTQDLLEYEGVALGLGVTGSHQRQVELDQPGRGARVRPNRGRDDISAVSCELIARYVPYGITGTALFTYELAGESRLEGYRFSLNLAFALPPLQIEPPPRE